MTTLVTVVTPCYNSVATLEATILSILSQNYQPIEYIIMDGGSNDGTLDIAHRYQGKLILVSEPDHGQSDAINKGWRRAKGDILAWLNADDQYLPNTVANAVHYLETHSNATWIYGTAESVDEAGNPFPYRMGREDWNYEALRAEGCFINQPSVFLRRQIVNEFGFLDESLHFSMDYEYWLRIGRKYPPHYFPSVKVRVIRSRTTKTESGGVERLHEIERMLRRYGVTDLPRTMHHEWVVAYTESALKDIRRGQWRIAATDFKQIWRYPSTLPKSFIKFFIRKFVPYRWETQLRQIFVREKQARPD